VVLTQELAPIEFRRISYLEEPSEKRLSAELGSMVFAASSAGGNPANQTIAVKTEPESNVSMTATTATANGIPWLGVASASGNTPGTVAVSITKGLFAPGKYVGEVTFSASGTANGVISVPVLLMVNGSPRPLQRLPLR